VIEPLEFVFEVFIPADGAFALDRQAGCLGDASSGGGDIGGGDVDAGVVAAELVCDDGRCAGADKGVEYPVFLFVIGCGTDADYSGQEAFGHLAGEAHTLLEGSADPGVFVPDIVGHFAGGVGPFVTVFFLPVGDDPDGIGIEDEVLLIVDEVEDVRVGPGELVFHLLAEGVVPDYPVSHYKTEVVGNFFYVGGVLITDGDVE